MSGLPAGQHALSELPRFGLPGFAKRLPELPARVEIRITDETGSATTLGLEELSALSRREYEGDFHCVATWSVRRLRWSGYAFRDFLQLASERMESRDAHAWVGMRGLDGYVASLPIEFASRADVLLADRLFGEPLDLRHGAPLRLVAPAHYGYKSVKHLAEVRLLRARPRGSPGWMEHLIGLVEQEQRVQYLPGWLFRWVSRPFVRPVAWHYRRNTPRAPE